MYIIGNQSFLTKKKATDYTRNILKNNFDKTITIDDIEVFEYLHALVSLHPYPDSKIGTGIESFYVGHDGYKNTALFINQKEEKHISISFIQICKFKPPTTEQFFKAAMRQAITYQIDDFKNNYDGELNCNFCGDNEKIQIDHILHFQKIYIDFLEKYEIKMPVYYDKEDKTNRCKFKVKDTVLRLLWCDYHKEVATLRPLCRTCNLKRPNYSISNKS